VQAVNWRKLEEEDPRCDYWHTYARSSCLHGGALQTISCPEINVNSTAGGRLRQVLLNWHTTISSPRSRPHTHSSICAAAVHVQPPTCLWPPPGSAVWHCAHSAAQKATCELHQQGIPCWDQGGLHLQNLSCKIQLNALVLKIFSPAATSPAGASAKVAMMPKVCNKKLQMFYMQL
jgi:hypothetical protein